MTENITGREWEVLSAYLDGELNPRERIRLEQKLQERSYLQAALTELQKTRRLLRAQPTIRSPRNFTLTPEMTGTRPGKRSAYSLFNSMRLASSLATVLFVMIVLGDVFLGSQAGRSVPMMADSQALQELTQPMEEAAVEEAPAIAQESMEPPLALQVERESEQIIGGTGTPEAGMMMEMPPGVEAAAKSAYPAEEETTTMATQSAYPALEEPPASIAPYPQADMPAQVEETPVAESVIAPESEETVSGFWTIWRYIEGALLVIGAITGALALYLRRIGRA